MPYPSSAETLAGIAALVSVCLESSVGTSMIKATPTTTAITKLRVKLSFPPAGFFAFDILTPHLLLSQNFLLDFYL